MTKEEKDALREWLRDPKTPDYAAMSESDRAKVDALIADDMAEEGFQKIDDPDQADAIRECKTCDEAAQTADRQIAQAQKAKEKAAAIKDLYAKRTGGLKEIREAGNGTTWGK